MCGDVDIDDFELCDCLSSIKELPGQRKYVLNSSYSIEWCLRQSEPPLTRSLLRSQWSVSKFGKSEKCGVLGELTLLQTGHQDVPIPQKHTDLGPAVFYTIQIKLQEGYPSR